MPSLLLNGAFELALAPRCPLPDGLGSQPLREEPLLAAVSEDHRLAAQSSIDLRDLQHEFFELWPRDMGPGYYDAVVAACRAAGFEPRRDPSAAGSIVWANIAQARGVGAHREVPGIAGAPRGTDPPVAPAAAAPLPIDVVWATDPVAPAVGRFGELARDVADRHGWLPTSVEQHDPRDSYAERT